MKNIFKFFGTILTVILAAALTGCSLEEQVESADLGLHIKVFFPTKVVEGQPMTINGSGFSEVTEIVFPGGEAGDDALPDEIQEEHGSHEPHERTDSGDPEEVRQQPAEAE